MKKSIYAIAVLVLLAAASVAQASVPVYSEYDFSGMITSATGAPGISAGQAYTGSIRYNTGAFLGNVTGTSYYGGPLQMTLTIGGTSYDMATVLRSTILADNNVTGVLPYGTGQFFDSRYSKTSGNALDKTLAARTAMVYHDGALSNGLFAQLDVQRFIRTPLGSQTTQLEFVKIEGTVTDMHRTPIPGAIWLLGSGLVGLVGLRKKSQRSQVQA